MIWIYKILNSKAFRKTFSWDQNYKKYSHNVHYIYIYFARPAYNFQWYKWIYEYVEIKYKAVCFTGKTCIIVLSKLENQCINSPDMPGLLNKNKDLYVGKMNDIDSSIIFCILLWPLRYWAASLLFSMLITFHQYRNKILISYRVRKQ